MQAEAEYWKRNQGYRTGWSDELLGFDCGGQQWVLEACFPAGSQRCAAFQAPACAYVSGLMSYMATFVIIATMHFA